MGIPQKCFICGQNAICSSDFTSDALYMECQNCGNYILHPNSKLLLNSNKIFVQKEKIKQYLFYNNSDNYKFIGTEDEFNDIKLCNPIGFNELNVKLITIEQILNWYPKSFAEKTDKILLYIAQHSNYDGEAVKLLKKEVTLLFFMHNKLEIDSINWDFELYYYLNYFVKNGYFDSMGDIDLLEYIDELDDVENPIEITLTPKALERVYELQKNQTNNKNVFVAMSFHSSAMEIRNAIKKGIEKAGYSAELMDEIVHNHQIVPEMLRLIKESRFLIMDITYPNFGAYYEAGYAQGLGKEVIVTCCEDNFNQKDFECEYKLKDDGNCWYKETMSKPHFDIAQKQILVWKDFDDLAHKLSEWIKFIIG